MRQLFRDPRAFQVASLSALLAWGLFGLDLEIRPPIALLVLATALATQAVGTRLAGLPRFDPKSALISALSLTLLLRTASPAIAALAAVLTIGSKFAFRLPAAAGGPPKHVFNPTNFGIAVTLLLTDRAWVSAGQWGSAALAAFAVACAGILVVRRAERSDVTWAFLTAYGAVVVGRALWLGDPLAIPLHQVSNGAFLIFAFFMISDPKTTPDSRAGRILFAVLVAFGAGVVHFILFRPNGLIWSLAALSPLVPAIDRVLPGRCYHWPGRAVGSTDPIVRPTPAVAPAAPERAAG
ncbi:MAG TPA: RnfABCDGE type electron transport complex subunit D [Thermoanaerobaculia bacterium]|nr:RnfABCDGE type electron transport complex subunit D [Thermoanaerobaculia bacterium]